MEKVCYLLKLELYLHIYVRNVYKKYKKTSIQYGE